MMSVFLIYNCGNEEDLLLSEIDYSIFEKSEMEQLMKVEQLIKKTLDYGASIKIDSPPDSDPDCYESKLIMKAKVDKANKGLLKNSLITERLHGLRDDLLRGKNTGSAYIEAYYYLSSKLKDNSITTSEVKRFLNVIPTIVNISKKINNPNYSGVVINENEKNELINMVNYYKSKRINDSHYQKILSVIAFDINTIHNRNSTQIEKFMKQ